MSPPIQSTLPSPLDETPANLSIFSSSDVRSMVESGPSFRVNKIREELFLMRQRLDDVQFTTSQNLLTKIIQNIVLLRPFLHTQLNDPDNDIKRSLNYLSPVFQERIGSVESGIEICSQLGFEPVELEGKSKLVMKREAFNENVLREVLQILAEMTVQKSPVEVAPSTESFDPTKSLVMKSIDYPSVQESIEKQVQLLQQKQQLFETQIPERNVCVMRAEKGFNPRNFGDATYQNMMQDIDQDSTRGDEGLIQEVMKRKQQQRENDMQFKTKAKRELESLKKQRMYKRTTIRVYLPDHTVIQAYFAPRETVRDVMDVVQSVLTPQYRALPFYLFNAPPKKMFVWVFVMSRLDPATVLRSEKMVPAAMVYLGWQVRE